MNWCSLRSMWAGFLAGGLCVVFAVSAWGQAGAGMQMENIKIPLDYDENGKLKGQLIAANATLSETNSLVEQPRIEMYTPTGEPDIVITADECTYARDSRTATSDKNVRIEKEDLLITGVGFDWDAAKELVNIRHDTRVEMTRNTLAAATNVVATEAGNLVTVITSEALHFDYAGMKAEFIENVVVTDPQIRLTADKLLVAFGEKNRVKILKAMGNVHFGYAEKSAVCEQAVYNVEAGEVVLTGEPLLKVGKDTMTGKRMTFWLTDGRMVCEEGKLLIYRGKEGDERFRLPGS